MFLQQPYLLTILIICEYNCEHNIKAAAIVCIDSNSIHPKQVNLIQQYIYRAYFLTVNN